MKTLLAALLLVFALAGCSKEQVVAKSAFTADMAARLRQADPALKVEITRELELKLGSVVGRESMAYLDNCYAQYRASPNDLEEIANHYVASYLEAHRAAKTENPLDPKAIVPVVKDRDWIAEVLETANEKKNPGKPFAMIYEALNTELVIVYAEDSPTNLAYLTPEKLEKAELKVSQLRGLAVENLKRVLPPVESHGDNGVYMLTVGGTFEPSLLLFDDLWRERKFQVDGDYVVAVPTRDLLLLTGSNNTDGIAKLRRLAKKAAAESSYRLTTDLFVYRDGKFVKFE